MNISIILVSFSVLFIFYWVYKNHLSMISLFDDGIDYSIKSPSMRLHKHIHNNIILKNKDKSQAFYQFYKIDIFTDNGIRTIDSMLVSNSGIFIFETYHYDKTVTYSDMGYTIKDSNGSHNKLHIPQMTDTTLIANVKHALSMYGDIDVSALNVFISKIKLKKHRPDNLLLLKEVSDFVLQAPKYNIKSISELVGALLVINTQAKKSKAS